MDNRFDEITERVENIMKDLPPRTQAEYAYHVLPEFTEIEKETGTRIECICFDEKDKEYSEKYVGERRTPGVENRRHYHLQTLYGMANTFNKIMKIRNNDLKNGHLKFYLSNEETELNVKALLPGANGEYAIIAVERDLPEGEYGKPQDKVPYLSATWIGKPGEIYGEFRKHMKKQEIDSVAAAASAAATMNTIEKYTDYTKFETDKYAITEEGRKYVIYGPK